MTAAPRTASAGNRLTQQKFASNGRQPSETLGGFLAPEGAQKNAGFLLNLGYHS
jgi:hypothetical protein